MTDFDPFNLVEVEVETCLQENSLQVRLQIDVYGRQRLVWIPRGAIMDMVGGRLIVVGEKVKKDMTYFTIKIPKHYAQIRGLVPKE